MTNKIVRADGTTVLQNVKSCIFSEAVNAETNLKFGCVSASRIDVICYGTQANAVQAGEALTYYQVVGGVETLIGTFYAEPVIPSRMTYSFTAYDALAKLDKDYSERLAELRTNFPMTIKALVQDAASVAGVTVATNSWADSDYLVNYFYADGITCRQILSWAAEIAGMFVQCNTSGQAVFRTYTAKSGYKIAPGTGTESGVTKVAYKQNGLTYANYFFDAVDGVNIHPSEEDQIGVLYPANATGNIVNLYGNLLLTDADDADYLRVATRLYNAYQGLDSYRPFEAKLFPSENPFRAGDIVNVTDAQGVSFSGMIYSLRVDSAEAVVSSSGNETFEEQTGQSTKSKITNLGANLVRLKNLFVENLEALVARIDNLFAQEITMTGIIHSDDYEREEGQPFANSGMALDFVKDELVAPYFALDDSGNLYCNSAYFGDMYFCDALGKSLTGDGIVPSSMVDAQGNPSTNYTFFAIERNPAYYYTVRPNQLTRYVGVRVGENGTLSYNIGSPPRYIRFLPMCDESIVEGKTKPHVKVYKTVTFPQQLPEELYAEFDIAKYGTYADAVITPKPNYFFFPKGLNSVVETYRVEVTLPNATAMRIDKANRYYSAFYSYDNNAVLGGDGTYVGTDGISAQKIMKGNYELPYYANDNLLDNWYFVYGREINNNYTNVGTFPVNQRGLSSSSASGYMIDRWRHPGSTMLVSVNKDYLTLTTTTSSGYGYNQYLEQPYSWWVGKTITASVVLAVASGLSPSGYKLVRVGGTLTVPSGDTGSNVYHYFTSAYDNNIRPRIIVDNGDTVSFSILINGSSTVNIVAAKLEIGDTQTLSHEEFFSIGGYYSEVLNEIPNYDEQLLRCRISTADSTDPYANNSIDYGDMVAIVQTTDTATRDISSEQFVIWKGSLYRASSAIASGATLSSSNLTAVSDGVANNFLPKTGGTLTGAIQVAVGSSQGTNGLSTKSLGIQDGVQPDALTWGTSIRFYDDSSTSRVIGMVHPVFYSQSGSPEGRQGVALRSRRYLNGNSDSYLEIGRDASGDHYVRVSDAVAWRNELGFGTDGAFPLTLAQGGTGGATAAAARANLGLGTIVETFTVPKNGTKAFTLTNTEIGSITVGGSVPSGGREFLVYYCSASGNVTYDKAFNASNINITKSSYSLTIENTTANDMMGFRQYYT